MSERGLRIIQLTASMVGLVGLLLTPLMLCAVILSIANIGSSYFQLENVQFSLLSLTVWGLLFGGGVAVSRQTRAAIKTKTFKPVRLPEWWKVGWGLAAALVVGIIVYKTSVVSMVLPLAALAAAVLPPLAAFTWSLHSQSDPDPAPVPDLPAVSEAGLAGADPPEPSPDTTIKEQPEPWRVQTLSSLHFSLAVLSGGSLAILAAILLEGLFPVLGLALVEGLYSILQEATAELLAALTNQNISQALSSYTFIFAFVQLALIAPLVEEMVKPIFILPLIRNASSSRQAFWIGAAAGLGFAAVENIIYFTFGIQYWQGLAPLRALGAAVHPLGAGLVALGWYEYHHRSGDPGVEQSAGQTWLKRFGLAVGLHALWNGGSLVLGELARAEFFGTRLVYFELGGLSLAGVILALLTVVGAAAWIGMRFEWAWSIATQPGAQLSPSPVGLARRERQLAAWALICLAVVLPLGLAALRLLEVR